jgi:hypothetical protein
MVLPHPDRGRRDPPELREPLLPVDAELDLDDLARLDGLGGLPFVDGMERLVGPLSRAMTAGDEPGVVWANLEP